MRLFCALELKLVTTYSTISCDNNQIQSDRKEIDFSHDLKYMMS